MSRNHNRWKTWQEYEGGPYVPAKGTHPYYNLARYGWKSSMRVAALQRFPVCQQCHRNRATVVDHRVEFLKPDGTCSWALFSDPTNHVALCASCHNTLTTTYGGGFGNARKEGKELHCNPTGAGGVEWKASSVSESKLSKALDFNADDLLANIPE
jgi:hypothetical protein